MFLGEVEKGKLKEDFNILIDNKENVAVFKDIHDEFKGAIIF